MDPYTSTREQFTNGLLDHPIPNNAHEDWKRYARDNQALLRKLAFHDAMQPDLQQTFMTPANSKNKVYFMWDFVGRTLGMLFQITPTSEFGKGTPLDKQAWPDVLTRSQMASDLILDTNPGMLDMMINSSYPGQPGAAPQFDAETLERARRLKM